MEKLRPPTDDEQKQMEEVSREAEIAVREALKAWAGTIFQLGFAAGVTKATETASGGVFVPPRPSIVV